MTIQLRCALLAGASTLLMAMPVHAQTTPAADDAVQGDIIVTAQRRDESLSKTPVAVAVLSADTLVKAQIVSEQDLRTATPGLSVRANLSSNQLNYSLRGQSQDAFSGTRPGVLPYINEVQIGGNGGSTAFYDLQSVQVLKGPQGTLFGRSATGGAVLFTTAKPTNEFGGYISALAGNYATYKVEGAINAPLAGDALMARLAGFYKSNHGFQRNLFTGGREGDSKRYGGRGSVSANLGDSVHNDLVVDYLHTNGSSTVASISGLLPFTGVGQPFIPIEFLYAGTATPVGRATGQATLAGFVTPAFAPLILPRGTTLATATPAQLAALNTFIRSQTDPFYNAYFTRPGVNASGIRAELAAQQARGPYVVNTDGRNIYRDRNLIVTNTTTFDVGADTVIKSIFGYTRLKSFAAYDADGTPFGISQSAFQGENSGGKYNTRQLSEELQLQGTAIGGNLTYVTGLYFSDEKTRTLLTSQFFDLVLGGNTLAAGTAQINNYDITNKTYAGYAQGTYALNDSGLSATLGLRYTSEKVGKVLLPGDVFRVTPQIPGTSYDQSRKYNRLSWQVGLQDQVNPNTLIYAVSRRAYKSGGFNGLARPTVGTAAVSGDTYIDERITDAEVGAKFQGRLGDTPARLNVALFHNWIKNSQRTAYTLVGGAPAALTVNVPQARVYGAELDAQIKPADWLTLGGSANYTHSRFGRDLVSANGILQIFDQVPDTPKHSGTVFADITAPVSGNIEVNLHGDLYAQTKTFTSPQSINNAGTVLPGYALANFRLGLGDPDAGWSLNANVKNAFDRTYFIGTLPTGAIYQVNVAVPGDRRTFTVEARFKF